MKKLILLFLILCTSSFARQSTEYKEFYSHLHVNNCHAPRFTPSEYFLVILVNARHLDYTDNRNFFRTLVKHPSDGSKNSDVGHAWIYLQGMTNGMPVCLEGGHSGELGEHQPRYFDGVLLNIENNVSNPVKYLWATLHDGFFQEGAGGHTPNYAIKINLSPSQFEKIMDFIEKYPFENYSITENQCSSFVVKVAEIAGLHLECRLSLNIESKLLLCGETITLWEDPDYSCLVFASPDMLERSLITAVKQGHAEYALPWYLRFRQTSHKEKIKSSWEKVYCFPSRFLRYIEFTIG